MTRLEKAAAEVESDFWRVDSRIRHQRYWKVQPNPECLVEKRKLLRRLDLIEWFQNHRQVASC